MINKNYIKKKFFLKKKKIFIKFKTLKKNAILKKKFKSFKYKILKKKKRKKLNIFYKMFGLRFYSIHYFFLKKKLKKKRLKVKKKFYLNLNFFFKKHNIFVNLNLLKKKKFITIKFWSFKMFNFNCSKRQIKFAITVFLKQLKILFKKIQFYIIKVTGPKYSTKILLKNLKRFHYKSKFIIVNSFKIFNGCRFKKLRRKKHLKFRLLR